MNMDIPKGYNSQVEEFRNNEYPSLQDVIYLDHAGTALPSKSLMEQFAQDMTSQLWCNPHSTSTAAQATSKRIERIRLRLLEHFSADPEDFDLVFIANATAGIKLVADAFRDLEEPFWYGYHAASHTSIVGVRELAGNSHCFSNDAQVESWLNTENSSNHLGPRLFAYPAQSNMNGRRLPLDWSRRVRALGGETFTLLDAAALISTSSLSLRDSSTAPDFVVVSLYKAFGFPDLGALIVRKATAGIWKSKRYFGGGTVDMVVTCDRGNWHAKKTNIHESLEDGSLPIHNILALDAALSTHSRLFGPSGSIATHCAALSQRLYDGLKSFKHYNATSVCQLYHNVNTTFDNLQHQGPIIAFNLFNSAGNCIGTTEVEKLASIRNIQFRTGQLCNPGGVALELQLSPNDVKNNYAAGQRCGSDFDILNDRPTGMIRASIGPENVLADIDKFLAFIKEFFVESHETMQHEEFEEEQDTQFAVERLMVYPIKSCSGWRVPSDKQWQIRPEGLAWDREWCIVRSGDGGVMNQKRYPKMALIRPTIDIDEGLLRVEFVDKSANIPPIAIPLTLQPTSVVNGTLCRNAEVCGDSITAMAYTLTDVTRFFTEALAVPCQLARFPPASVVASARHAKPHLQPKPNKNKLGKATNASPLNELESRPILLSNESPILIVSRSSINRLNEQIKANNGKAVGAEAFRPNIVIMERQESRGSRRAPERPYLEDEWRMINVGGEMFELLGRCRRCQMVCIDQETGMRNQEPFVTLAKTRRMDGKVYFGQHACHVEKQGKSEASLVYGRIPTIAVGDYVTPIW